MIGAALQRPAVRYGAMLALLALALTVPRSLGLRDLEVTASLDYEDGPFHQAFLDADQKREAMPRLAADPYFGAHPEMLPEMLVPHWPPGLYKIAGVFAGVFGPASLWTTQLTNLLFALIMVVAVIGLGAALGGPRLGLWAGLLTLLCPPLLGATWYLSPDFPLAAMVTGGLFLLHRSRRFGDRWATLLLGLWSALGLYIKPTYALYLVGPALLVLVQALRARAGRKKALLNAGLGALVAVTLFVLLYPGWDQVPSYIRRHFVDVNTQLPGTAIRPLTLEWLLAYAKLVFAAFPWPLLLLVLPGLVLLVVRGWRTGAAARLLLVFVGSSYLLLTLVSVKMERYAEPLYPVLCLLAAWWIVRLVPRRWQLTALLWSAVTFGGVLWVVHQRPTPWLPARWAALPRSGPHKPNAFHPMRYELTPPGGRRLAALRRWRWDAECRIGPLLNQARRWIEEAPGRRPVGLSLYPGIPHRIFLGLLPALCQEIRDRFVITHLYDYGAWPLLPGLARAPTLIVLQPPNAPITEKSPGIQVVARRRFDVHCRGGDVPLVLTWARPREE